MANNEKGVVTLELTQKMITNAPSPEAILSIPAVAQNWIDKHNLATGSSMGEQAYELEKMYFANKIKESPKLAQCDRFTLYAAWMLHSISGLRFALDQAYITPFKGKAVWQPGWKGRLAQIQQWPTVVSTTEPEVVYDCDQFEFATSMQGKRLTKDHVKVFPRPAGAQMIYVYMIIQYRTHAELYTMDRDEVNQIRDMYSESYKFYIANNGKWKDGGPMDKPLALSNPAQYWRKTLVKRIYNNNSNAKTAAQKVLDSQTTKEIALGDDFTDALPFNQVDTAKPAAAELTEQSFADVLNVPSGESEQAPVQQQQHRAEDIPGVATVLTELPAELQTEINKCASKADLIKLRHAMKDTIFHDTDILKNACNDRLAAIVEDKKLADQQQSNDGIQDAVIIDEMRIDAVDTTITADAAIDADVDDFLNS